MYYTVNSGIVKVDTGKVQTQQFFSVPNQLFIVLCPFTPIKQSVDMDLPYQIIKHRFAIEVTATHLNVLERVTQ